MKTTLYIVKNPNGSISGNLPLLTLTMMQGFQNTLTVDTFEWDRVYIEVPDNIKEYYNSIIYNAKCFVRGSQFVILPNADDYSLFPNALLEWNYDVEMDSKFEPKDSTDVIFEEE